MDAGIATVCFGAVLETRAKQSKAERKAPPTSTSFTEILRQCGVDLLFRVASSALTASPTLTADKPGLLRSAEELESAIR